MLNVESSPLPTPTPTPTVNRQSDQDTGRKAKLMYTSDFLKSFDKAPKSATPLSWEDFCESCMQDKQHADKMGTPHDSSTQLRHMLLRVRDLVLVEHAADEPLVRKVREIFNEHEEGRTLLAASDNGQAAERSTALKTVSPLKSSFDGEHFGPILGEYSSAAASAGTNTSADQSWRTPRRVSPTEARPPLPPTSPTAASAGKTSPVPAAAIQVPAAYPSKSPLRVSGGGLPGPIAPPASAASSIGVIGSGKANPKTIKKSPSMSVIPTSNLRRSESQSSVMGPSSAAGGASSGQLRLKERTKSIEDMSSLVRDRKPGDEKKARPAGQQVLEEPVPRKNAMKKSVSMSSIFMDDSKNPTLKCTSLDEIVGQIYPLTKYQAGCRFLQKKLEEQPDAAHVTIVFNEVFEHLIELMTDPYGQYLVPKLMKYCDKAQRQAIVQKIAPKISEFACHTYGIHGVQKILEFLNEEQIQLFVAVIRPRVIDLAKDAKGNYLIQSFLKQFPPETNQFIYDAISERIVEVATHKVGCTLLNRCVDNANEPQVSRLVDRLAAHSLVLVQDQFGNYVIQHLLAAAPQHNTKLIRSLLGHIPELSVQKFSSNVIEKCLQVADPETYDFMTAELCAANLLDLLQDRYANFVIQTALDVADETQHARLVKMILPYIHQIKTPYVMHIQKKILQV